MVSGAALVQPQSHGAVNTTFDSTPVSLFFIFYFYFFGGGADATQGTTNQVTNSSEEPTGLPIGKRPRLDYSFEREYDAGTIARTGILSDDY